MTSVCYAYVNDTYRFKGGYFQQTPGQVKNKPRFVMVCGHKVVFHEVLANKKLTVRSQ